MCLFVCQFNKDLKCTESAEEGRGKNFAEVGMMTSSVYNSKG